MTSLGQSDAFRPPRPQFNPGSWGMMNKQYAIDPFTGRPVAEINSNDDGSGEGGGAGLQTANGNKGVNGPQNPNGGPPTKNERGEELADSNAISGLQQLASAACGSGCGHCLAMNPSLLQQGKATKSDVSSAARANAKAQSDEVIRHELAHIAGAKGKVATGSPQYTTQTMNVGGETISMIVAGSVSVSPPNPNGDPKDVKDRAQAMYDGATAPEGIAGGLSGADRSVAAMAQGIMAQQDQRLAQMEQAKTMAATDQGGAKRLLQSAQISPEQQAVVLAEAQQKQGGRNARPDNVVPTLAV